MDLYLQMGHGMQSICTELSSAWNGATVILSPQNIYPTRKILSFAESMKKTGGKVLFDPQLYTPRKYQKNLQKHDYWPTTDITSVENGNCIDLLNNLADINISIDSEAFIIPSSVINKIDHRWVKMQGLLVDQTRVVANGQRVLLTLALGKDILLDEMQIEWIIQYAEQWNIDGVYIVCEHPESRYLVENPTWVLNLLKLVAGIKRLGKKVIVGYANHQMLILALAKCDAIASGIFLNVRWFQKEHFETIESGERSRHTIWYYCPQALSEFKVTYLDIAHRVGILDRVAPPSQMTNEYSNVLFEGANPSSTAYSERDSFMHYLHCLRIQCNSVSRRTYVETKNALFVQLETAGKILHGLHSERIKGQNRDFSEICDVNEAAVQTFDREYGFPMSQEWETIFSIS